MFTKSNIVLPHNYDEYKDKINQDNFNNKKYNEIFLCNNKNNCKPPSKILEDKIKFKNSIFDEVTLLEEKKGNNIYDYQSGFILNSYFTNNMCVNNNCCILPCDNSNCITKNIFNIMILCCNLVYSLINQTRVSINDYFYSTDLIDELCFMYTLNNNDDDLNKKILDILEQYYKIIFNIIIFFSSETSDDNINNYVKIHLNFLNQNLSNFLNGKDITVNEFNTSEDKRLINLLKLFKNYYNNFINNKKLNYFEKIQKITVDDYINYFEEAYKIIKEILNNNFNDFYSNVYIYNYNNNNYLSKIIKLRTYLLLMFIYKIRFINLNDVDDKGGRQAEFFISNVLRDFYNYYYIDNKFISNDNTIIKIIYKDIILKELLQYNFYTKNYNLNNRLLLKKILNELLQYYNESYYNREKIDLIKLFKNNIIPLIIYANNNIITLEFYDNNNELKERFIPFEKMYNINECSYNEVRTSNGKIGGDLIYLHECYTNNTLNSNSICIIVDSKAYQDSSYIFKYKIDKTIIQCYLYAQYVKKCYKDHIYNYNNEINLYLCAVNPIYGSYYVYKYNDIEKMYIIKEEKKKKTHNSLNSYLNDNYINTSYNSNKCTDDDTNKCTDDNTEINNNCNAKNKLVMLTLPPKIRKEIEEKQENTINLYKNKLRELLKTISLQGNTKQKKKEFFLKIIKKKQIKNEINKCINILKHLIGNKQLINIINEEIKTNLSINDLNMIVE